MCLDVKRVGCEKKGVDEGKIGGGEVEGEHWLQQFRSVSSSYVCFLHLVFRLGCLH